MTALTLARRQGRPIDAEDPQAASSLHELEHWRTRSWYFVLALTVLFNFFVLERGTFAGRLYIVAFLLVIPGAVCLSLLPVRPVEASVRLAWSVATSLLLIMLLGLLASVVMPALGMSAPLQQLPLLIGTDLVLFPLMVATRRRGPLDFLITGSTPQAGHVARVVILSVPPVAAIGGTEMLNNGRGGLVTIAVVLACALLLAALVVGGAWFAGSTVSFGLYVMTVSLLFLTTMRSGHPYGYDVQTEFQVFSSTLKQGAWHVPPDGNAYASMLSITVLPTVISALSGMSPVYLFKFLYPVIFAIFPVLVYITCSRMFPRRASLIGASLVIVQGLFLADIAGLARQEVALLYFGLLAVSAFGSSLGIAWRRVGVFISVLGMSVTHYSTAYFASLVLIGGVAVGAGIRLVKRRSGGRTVISLPVVAASVAPVVLWNVLLTRSVSNIGHVATSLTESGLGLLPGTGHESLIVRFLTATLTPQLSAVAFGRLAIRYYRRSAPYLHPYPISLTSRYPVRPPVLRVTGQPNNLATFFNSAGAVASELTLLVVGIGILVLLLRALRNLGDRELASLALSCLLLVGILRLSSTLSSLYDGSRALVQAAPLFSVGMALVCSWLFGRRKPFGSLFVVVGMATVLVMLLSSSGLSDALAGGNPDLFSNGGEAYQRYYFTDADIASAQWVVDHQRPDQVVYADVYAALQIWEFHHINGLVTTVLPSVIEPGSYVYASSTNRVEGTARSLIGNDFAIYAFPQKFLDASKNVVFTTGTTEVYL